MSVRKAIALVALTVILLWLALRINAEGPTPDCWRRTPTATVTATVTATPTAAPTPQVYFMPVVFGPLCQQCPVVAK